MRAVVLQSGLAALAALAALVGACSSPKPPSATPPRASASASAPPPDEGPSRAERMAMRSKAIVLSCLNQAPEEKEYCTCSARELTTTLTLEELESQHPDPARVKMAYATVSKRCPASESLVKENYSNACLANRKELVPYCDCTWAEFRKRFSPAELGSDDIVQDERFVAARAPVVKACEKKMIESVAQDSFLKTCARDATFDKFCGCAWKEARKIGSAAELEAGVVPVEKIRAKADAACGKLKPKPTDVEKALKP